MDEYVYIDDSKPQSDAARPVMTRPTISKQRLELLPTTFDTQRVIRAESGIYSYATEFDAPQPTRKKCSGNNKIWKGLAAAAAILVAIALTTALTRFTLKPELNNPILTNETKVYTGTSCK